MRRLLPLLLLPALAACGGSKPSSGVAFAGASGRTVSADTASFSLTIEAEIAGAAVHSSETGSLSFTARRAHFYKLVPGSSVPQEIVLDGAITYTNANVDAALRDPSVKPWTKLDTRRVPPAERRRRPDELAHVRALAYLASGVADPKRLGVVGARTHFRGLVDPRRVVAAARGAERAALRTALRNDYLARPFAADFWLDEAGRVRRVRVDYRTAGGGHIVVDGGFSNFGAKVDLTVPQSGEIQDITPR